MANPTLKSDVVSDTNDWKTVGFCDRGKVPLLTLKVPKNFQWNLPCSGHHVTDGVEYCGPNDTTPTLSGRVAVGDKVRELEIGVEAAETLAPHSPAAMDLNVFDTEWGAYGALQSKSFSSLGGYRAYLGEIEDSKGTLPKNIKVQTLLYFSHSYIGGMMYFVETELTNGTKKFVPHGERFFKSTIDKIRRSFTYKVRVEDPPQRLQAAAMVGEAKSKTEPSEVCLPPEPRTLKDRYERADIVIIGKVVKVAKADHPKEEFDSVADVKVDKILKGHSLDSAKIRFLSYGSKDDGRVISSCSPDLEGASFSESKEKSVLIFATKYDSEFFTSDRDGGGVQFMHEDPVKNLVRQISSLASN